MLKSYEQYERYLQVIEESKGKSKQSYEKRKINLNYTIFKLMEKHSLQLDCSSIDNLGVKSEALVKSVYYGFSGQYSSRPREVDMYTPSYNSIELKLVYDDTSKPNILKVKDLDNIVILIDGRKAEQGLKFYRLYKWAVMELLDTKNPKYITQEGKIKTAVLESGMVFKDYICNSLDNKMQL